MTLLIVRHLLLSGIGVGALFLIALAQRLSTPRDAVLRYRLMVATLFTAALLLPLQAITAELTPRPSPPVSPTSCTAPNPAPVSDPGAAPALADCSVPAPAAESAAPFVPVVASSGSAGAGASSASTLLEIYLAGAVVVVGLHAVRALAVRRLLRRARPVTDPRVLQLWGRIVAGLPRPPTFLECDGLHAPACRGMVGGGRPAVIVPIESGALDDDTLLAALQHELIHLRRRDGAVALLAAAMSAILWFQPLVWVFARVLRADREHSCDALVVRTTRQPRSYALALLRFCNPPASAHRAMSLIGFESARSIRRRITMLARALQPAARPRHALVLGIGLACLASASAAHALLTAAAGPGPALSAEPAKVNEESATSGDKVQPSPRMTAEVAATADGRSDEQVYRRLVKHGVIAPSDIPPRDDLWTFSAPDDKSFGVRSPIAPSATVTDQETVLSAEHAHADGNTLYADRVRLSLPEGSKLRAVFEGRTVNIEPGAKDGTRILVTRGTVRIVDDRGVTRIQARASSERDDTTLTLTSTLEAGEFNFELTATDGSRPVSVRLDIRTDVPESNREPPHGAIRWKLAAPQGGPGTCELKMQWIYDLRKLARSVGC